MVGGIARRYQKYIEKEEFFESWWNHLDRISLIFCDFVQFVILPQKLKLLTKNPHLANLAFLQQNVDLFCLKKVDKKNKIIWMSLLLCGCRNKLLCNLKNRTVAMLYLSVI